MRTIKEIFESGEQLNEFSVLLKDGTIVEGYLIQERVDKTKDTEGYNIYDMREGNKHYYSTLEENVCVNWSDSIATKQKINFGEKGYIEIDNSDIEIDD